MSKSTINNRDTMQAEYDFSKAVRGATAKRYAEGTNVAVIQTDVIDAFPLILQAATKGGFDA
jgi:hypothetical protein